MASTEGTSFGAEAKSLMESQGVAGFYRGIDANISRAMVLNGTKMACYDERTAPGRAARALRARRPLRRRCKQAVVKAGTFGGPKDILVQAVSAFGAGFFMTCAAPLDPNPSPRPSRRELAPSAPFDMVRTKLMNQPPDKIEFTGFVDCFVKVVKKDGPGGLYRGFFPIWARFAPTTTPSSSSSSAARPSAWTSRAPRRRTRAARRAWARQTTWPASPRRSRRPRRSVAPVARGAVEQDAVRREDRRGAVEPGGRVEREEAAPGLRRGADEVAVRDDEEPAVGRRERSDRRDLRRRVRRAFGRSVAAAGRQGHAVAEGRRDGGVVEGSRRPQAGASRRTATMSSPRSEDRGRRRRRGPLATGAGRLQAAPEGRRRDRREAQGRSASAAAAGRAPSARGVS
ncbi:mitochondrial oxoglutarate transporter [Aureococcus anophagefferens]|uniref:Mitochondrial oxoglutarate transporter n=1 Tax=Aureococcus anophagefferens TaxID=44056 RepID=A0ABR1FUB0_AURAN